MPRCRNAGPPARTATPSRSNNPSTSAGWWAQRRDPVHHVAEVLAVVVVQRRASAVSVADRQEARTGVGVRRLAGDVPDDLDRGPQRQPVADALAGQVDGVARERLLADGLDRLVGRARRADRAGVGLRVRELPGERHRDPADVLEAPGRAEAPPPRPGGRGRPSRPGARPARRLARVNGWRAHAPGDALMCPHTVSPRRPPGASTRSTSESASGVVPQMPRKLVTTSKEPSAQGRACMSPTRRSAPGDRSRATATSRAEASRPAQVAPRAAASSTARPEPQATSSSRSPARTPSSWCTATYSRQLPGSLSAAKSAARRPQPSSTPRHCSSVLVMGARYDRRTPRYIARRHR